MPVECDCIVSRAVCDAILNCRAQRIMLFTYNDIVPKRRVGGMNEFILLMPQRLVL